MRDSGLSLNAKHVYNKTNGPLRNRGNRRGKRKAQGLLLGTGDAHCQSRVKRMFKGGSAWLSKPGLRRQAKVGVEERKRGFVTVGEANNEGDGIVTTGYGGCRRGLCVKMQANVRQRTGRVKTSPVAGVRSVVLHCCWMGKGSRCCGKGMDGSQDGPGWACWLWLVLG